MPVMPKKMLAVILALLAWDHTMAAPLLVNGTNEVASGDYTVTSTDTNSAALQAINSGSITATNKVSSYASGDNRYGVYANTGGYIHLNGGVDVQTNGVNGYGF
ncbi:hypothetical protein D0847_13535 [Bordetella avium]|nr:hypothetical protein D0432_14120 [Bordetella avium]RIQ19269.1 hypothetical protein D0850_04190 [Bordetella avium]RIQ40092.1 hypothetical protein D0847_13535 [Bordetella avium]